MIRSQQRAWQDQLTARHQIPPPDDSLSIHTITSTEDTAHGRHIDTTPTSGEGGVPDLSISTLRSSVLSSNEEGRDSNTSSSSQHLPPTPTVSSTPSPHQPTVHPSPQMADKSLSLSTLDTNSSREDQQQQQQQSWTTIDEEEQRVETRPRPGIRTGLQHINLLSPSTSPSSVRSPPPNREIATAAAAALPKHTAVADDDVPPPPSSSSLSLQEAFLLKKENFVQQSLRRREEVGRRARQRQAQQHQINNRGEKKRAVTFSLPSFSSTSITDQTQPTGKL